MRHICSWFNDSLGSFVAYGTTIWSIRFHGEPIDLLDHWEHITSHVSFPCTFKCVYSLFPMCYIVTWPLLSRLVILTLFIVIFY